MKKFFIYLVLIANIAFSQNGRNNIWYFGNQAGIDFNSGSAIAITNSSMYANEGCATLCDENGNLVMYTNGETVWNKNHNIMVNGTELNGSHSASQSGMILPSPAQNNQVYIFTIDYEGNSNGLQYSIVDMNLQQGLGEVTSKNIPLISPTTEMITAVKHSNGSDIWVIVHKWNSDKFYAYLITPSGIQSPVITAIGDVFTGTGGNAVGQMKFNTKGNKLGIINRNTNHIQIFDFDASTGIFSNEKTITGIINYAYGLEFDKSGRYIYYSRYNGSSSGAEIYQYNVFATDITATQALIGSTSDHYVGALQMAPDGKIYLARYNNLYLGVINNPSAQGTACNFVANGFYLGGKQSIFGLPSQILIDINNYTLVDTTICLGDSIYLQNAYQFTSGIYIDTLTDVYGNDSIIETELTVNVLNISLGNDTTICNGESLILNAGNFNNYQWNTGDTTQMLNVSSAGYYSVEVYDSIGCHATASINVSIDDCLDISKRAKTKYNIFPNPTKGEVSIKIKGIINIDVINSIGEIVYSTSKNKFNLSFLPKGIYWIKIKTKNNIGIEKLIIK